MYNNSDMKMNRDERAKEIIFCNDCTTLEKLKEIFNIYKDDIKTNRALYYALLGVFDDVYSDLKSIKHKYDDLDDSITLFLRDLIATISTGHRNPFNPPYDLGDSVDYIFECIEALVDEKTTLETKVIELNDCIATTSNVTSNINHDVTFGDMLQLIDSNQSVTIIEGNNRQICRIDDIRRNDKLKSRLVDSKILYISSRQNENISFTLSTNSSDQET